MPHSKHWNFLLNRASERHLKLMSLSKNARQYIKYCCQSFEFLHDNLVAHGKKIMFWRCTKKLVLKIYNPLSSLQNNINMFSNLKTLVDNDCELTILISNNNVGCWTNFKTFAQLPRNQQSQQFPTKINLLEYHTSTKKVFLSFCNKCNTRNQGLIFNG